MITRYVYLRLKPEHRGRRGELVERARRELGALPTTLGFRAGTPADGPSEAAWDICFEIRLEDLAAVEAWQADPVHRAYVDGVLAPLVQVKKAWNFST